jgi:membrane associated rhomboid family serine protease
VEHTFGPLRTLVIYIICGIGGNIFSDAVDTGNYDGTLKAGASTALFGMIGVVLGYIIINWVGMHRVGEGMRCNILCIFFFLLIFVLIFTPSTGNIDYYGHLGGFLTGVWITGFLQSLLDETREKVIKGLFMFFFTIQFAATFLGFFLTH